MKVGDLVRYKGWWGGHIGRCVKIEKMWSGDCEYVFYWFLDKKEEVEDPIQLEIIDESR
tara:strand:+ start:951 stop:1127 length:177 start_codon:yes stop_codon:yes gene_type:complete